MGRLNVYASCLFMRYVLLWVPHAAFPFFLSLTECVTTIRFVYFHKGDYMEGMGDFLNEFTESFAKLSFWISIEKLTESDIQMMEYLASWLHLRLKTHCIKYATIRVFTDPYSPV